MTPDQWSPFDYTIHCPGAQNILAGDELTGMMTNHKHGAELITDVFGSLAHSFSEQDAIAELKEKAHASGTQAVVDWCNQDDRCGIWAATKAALFEATPQATGGWNLDLQSAAARFHCRADQGEKGLHEARSVCRKAIQEFLHRYLKT